MPSSKFYPEGRTGFFTKWSGDTLEYYRRSGAAKFLTVNPAASGSVFQVGSYSSKYASTKIGGGVFNTHVDNAGTGFTYHTFNSNSASAASTSGVVGHFHETSLESGASTTTAQTMNLHLNIKSGSTLSAGSFPAIGTCLWLKMFGNGPSVAASAICAPLWIDNSLGGGAVGSGAREYGIILGVGGTVPYAAFGFHSTGAGWTYLFDFRQNVTPVGAAVTACSGSDASLALVVAGTPYYIPLYDSLAS